MTLHAVVSAYKMGYNLGTKSEDMFLSLLDIHLETLSCFPKKFCNLDNRHNQLLLFFFTIKNR